MKKIFLFIFTVFTFYLSAQTIVGGSGNCMINGNPNSVLNLRTINQKFNCAIVIDTTTGDHWIYKVSLVQGSRWENRTQIVKDSINSINTRLGVFPTKPYVDSSIGTKWTIGGDALNADGSIGTNTAYVFSLKTNNTERMRIMANGNIAITGLGTIFNNANALDIQANAATAGLRLGTSISAPINFYTQGINRAVINSTGNFGIGVQIPTNNLHVVGANPIRAEGLQTGTSTDQLVTVDATGVFKQRTVSDVTNYSSYATISSSTTYTATSPSITKTTGTITVTLPTALSASNKSFTFIKSDISTVLTIQANGSETINNANFITSNSQWDRITLFSTDTEWLVIGQ